MRPITRAVRQGALHRCLLRALPRPDRRGAAHDRSRASFSTWRAPRRARGHPRDEHREHVDRVASTALDVVDDDQAGGSPAASSRAASSSSIGPAPSNSRFAVPASADVAQQLGPYQPPGLASCRRRPKRSEASATRRLDRHIGQGGLSRTAGPGQDQKAAQTGRSAIEERLDLAELTTSPDEDHPSNLPPDQPSLPRQCVDRWLVVAQPNTRPAHCRQPTT